MNNKSLLTVGAAALVAVIAVSGFAFGSFASDDQAQTSPTTFERGAGFGQGMGRNITDEQKAEFEAKRLEREEERNTHRAAMNEAMAGGYESWVRFVKENISEEAPILSIINEKNFAKFKDGHDLMKSGREIMADLGIEHRGMGLGVGTGCGVDKSGVGHMMGGKGKRMNQNTVSGAESL